MPVEIKAAWCPHEHSRFSSQQLAPSLAHQSIPVGWGECTPAPSPRSFYSISVELDRSRIQSSPSSTNSCSMCSVTVWGPGLRITTGKTRLSLRPISCGCSHLRMRIFRYGLFLAMLTSSKSLYVRRKRN